MDTSSQFFYFIVCEVSPAVSFDVDMDKSGEGEGEEVGNGEGR